MLRDRRKEKLVGGLGMLPSREYLRKGLNLGEKVQNKNYAPGDVVPRPIDIWGNSTMGWCRRTHESARRAGNQ